MSRLALTLLASLLALPSLGVDPPARPKITGISSVRFYVSDLSQSRIFYAKTLDPSIACIMCEERGAMPFTVSFASGQAAFFSPVKGDRPNNFLTDIYFSTDDLKAMRRYLEANNIHIESPAIDVDRIQVKDPEGHNIWFTAERKPPTDSTELPLRIIHAGFIVKDSAEEDKFYRDILGFRPYWHGGMKDDETTWVSLQVPDGSDWLEYMLYDDSKADKHFRGVMNHFAVGVVNIQAEAELLTKRGWNLTEEPKLGRDGKWQLNLYDPDDTRVEFMEFTPKEKPCCSDFTAPHPKP
ncbi:MAG TPA: VOC family protein [Candidatus Dormibacteraeota bacterium]|jgi:catechol 2,3-dioxygenase-like lactoylglutathione lyase family enzyme|nr:VOC family protein [Candidatus Dormibacteraeota bacterium]